MRTNEFFAKNEKNGSRFIKRYQEKHLELWGKEKGPTKNRTLWWSHVNSDMDTRDNNTPGKG